MIHDREEPVSDKRSELEGREQIRQLFSRSVSSDAASRFQETVPSRPQEPKRENEDAKQSPSDLLQTKGDLQRRLLDEIGKRKVSGSDSAAVTRVVRDFVEGVLVSEEILLNAHEREHLADELLEEVMGLGPLAPLLADPAVTDILVNGPSQVFVERFGLLSKTSTCFRDGDHLIRVIERLAAGMGRRIDQASPMVDFRLRDGSRVNATIPPISVDYPTLSIRRFGQRRLRRSDLIRLGSASPEILQFLEHVVRARKNALISGGTGAGKSTLLGALAEAIPEDERIVTIEDTAELKLDQEHVIRLETRSVNTEGEGRISARDLVINSLRMRPSRIIVGEVRGGEALDMLQAMNTGHEGSLTTVHANSARDALARLETMVLMAGLELPSRAIREQIVSALQFLVQVRRYEDGVRRIESVAEITGMEGETPLLQEIFRFRRIGRDGERVKGEFVSTGIVPRFVEEARSRGVEIPLQLFRGASGRGG